MPFAPGATPPGGGGTPPPWGLSRLAAARRPRSNAEIKVRVAAAKGMNLDDCIESIVDAELVEVTPKSIRRRDSSALGEVG